MFRGGTTRRRRRDESGSALVELALVMSLLMMILFGIITFGLLMSFNSQMTQAAEEGARAVIADQYPYPNATAYATAAANRSLQGSGRSCGSGVTCAVTIIPCNGHSCVQVVLTASTSGVVPNFPIVSFAVPSQVTQTAVVQLNDLVQ